MGVEETGNAGSEPAPSAVEPVALYRNNENGNSWLQWLKSPDGYADRTALYASPPAPSVAVKALEWDHEAVPRFVCSRKGVLSYTIMTSRNRVYGIPGEHDGAAEFTSLEEAKAAAQADYEARIRSTLSAQVQDVAGNATICVGEQTIARLRNGLPVEFDNGLALLPSSDLEDEDIGPHEKALRDAVEPFLDWLEQREEGAHIAEVREGLIGVEDVIPDDHVVLGAHLRAQKDQGVLTIGHFRRLQAAYDGKISALPAAPAKQEGSHVTSQ